MRRLDRTGWLRGEGEPWLLALRAIAETRPSRVLDAGCGNGDFAELITAPNVVCVDSSPAAVAAARSRGLSAQVADIRELPFADGSFDVVVCNWVLYHARDRAHAIGELARVLRHSGRLVGCYNGQSHLAELWAAVGRSWPEDGFTCETAARELRRSFTSVECRDAQTEVLWTTRDALQSYLDAYREILGPVAAPAGPYPFRAARRNCVLVAMRA